MRGRVSPLVSLGLAALTFEVVLLFGRVGDYATDAGPAVSALASGHVLAALRAEPLMGTLSILLRAPAVALARAAGGDAVTAYRAGAVVCLLPAVWLALRLSASVGDATASDRLRRAAIGVLVVASPATVAAVALGHPEEVLAAVLVVAAVGLAAEERAAAAGLALGLAVATKQWALVAIAPSLAAAPRAVRFRLGAIATGTAAALLLPVMVVDAASFIHSNAHAAGTGGMVVRATLWFVVAHAHVLHLHVPAGIPTQITVYTTPGWVSAVAHPLIVLLPLPIVGLVRRRKRQPPPTEMLGVLALILLFRCVLDPVDNAYYHAPLVLALVAWEALSRARFPIVSVFAAFAIWLTFDHLDPGARPAVTNGFYLAWTTALAAYLCYSLLARRDDGVRLAVPLRVRARHVYALFGRT